MRIAAQMQAEMPDIIGVIFCLALRAQHDLIDQFLMIRAFNGLKNPVELCWLQLRALGKTQIKRT